LGKKNVFGVLGGPKSPNMVHGIKRQKKEARYTKKQFFDQVGPMERRLGGEEWRKVLKTTAKLVGGEGGKTDARRKTKQKTVSQLSGKTEKGSWVIF